MHYGIEVVNLGPYADPQPVIELAVAAEATGWEALFVWDHLGFAWGAPSGDPWIALAGAATTTTHLALGTGVAVLPRYKPQVLARLVATLDRLSGGRLVLGVGLGGVAAEYTSFGEVADAKVHASTADEALDVLSRLLSGETVRHKGQHYVVNGVALSPLPVQQPRVPIWIGGESRPALRRAARWDGWIIYGANEDGTMCRTPDEMARKIATIRRLRASEAPFDVAMTGYTQPTDSGLASAFAAAGVTWWLESLHARRGSHDELLARVKAGPPE